MHDCISQIFITSDNVCNLIALYYKMNKTSHNQLPCDVTIIGNLIGDDIISSSIRRNLERQTLHA